MKISQKRGLNMKKSQFYVILLVVFAFNINCLAFKGLMSNELKIIDVGLTDYLKVQNIYAMYRLQRWMFILSVVVALATIVSVLSGWNELTQLWKKIMK